VRRLAHHQQRSRGTPQQPLGGCAERQAAQEAGAADFSTFAASASWYDCTISLPAARDTRNETGYWTLMSSTSVRFFSSVARDATKATAALL
jgi:hypothetical protein